MKSEISSPVAVEGGGEKGSPGSPQAVKLYAHVRRTVTAAVRIQAKGGRPIGTEINSSCSTCHRSYRQIVGVGGLT